MESTRGGSGGQEAREGPAGLRRRALKRRGCSSSAGNEAACSSRRPRDQSVTRVASSWIVLKFGGTSVSSLPNWRNIAAVIRDRLASGARVLLVHSAITGITDRLEKLLEAALVRAPDAELRAIEERHARLAAELGIAVGVSVEQSLAELRQIAA